MQTKLVSSAELEEAGRLLREGEVVAFPTETVYGLGANALDPQAVRKIFEAKGRPGDNPLIVHVPDLTSIRPLIRGELPETAKRLARAFWPGPMTLILPKSDRIPKEVSAGLDTVGIRMPSHPLCRELLKIAGVPVAAPSANRSGRPSPTKALDVLEDMNGLIPMIVDGGDSNIGVESTVISLLEEPVRILRPGGITPEMICEVLGDVTVDETALKPLAENGIARSPGMKYRHYAPKGKLILLEGGRENVVNALRARYAEAAAEGKKVCLLLPTDLLAEFADCRTMDIGGDEAETTHRIFACLRKLDRENVELAFCPTFETKGIGLALMNRLDRAAGFDVQQI